MNEASDGSEGASSLPTAHEAEKREIKATSENKRNGKEQNERDGSKGAQGRAQSSRQRRDQKPKGAKIKPQEKPQDQSSSDDKDAISWLNKKITKQETKDTGLSSNGRTQRNSKQNRNSAKAGDWRDFEGKSRTESYSGKGNRKSGGEKHGKENTTKAGNWKERDDEQKGRTESSSGKGYRKSDREKQGKVYTAKPENWREVDAKVKGGTESSSGKGNRTSEWEKHGKDERHQPNQHLDFEKRKQFGADKRDRKHRDYPPANKKENELQSCDTSLQSSNDDFTSAKDVVEIGANVNVVNGKYISRNRQHEQQDSNNIMQTSDSQYQQYSDMSSQPQVYVYGGLHVYNAPCVDQQYYSSGQQSWYNYNDQQYQNLNYGNQQSQDVNYDDKQYQDFKQPHFKPEQKMDGNKVKGPNKTKKADSKDLPGKFRQQKSSILVDPNHSIQASALTEQLLNESYECMVCCEKVRCHAPVWGCTNCYHLFHLRCVRKWAKSPAALVEGEDGGWRCPACQNIDQLIPNVYHCFCGKSVDPMWNPRDGITPHSCGELCKKKRESSDCPHLCNQLCHPGPCPSCPVMVTKACMCGKMTQQTRCGQTAVIQCKEVCGKTLNCGIHFCDRTCHEGSCGFCELDEEQVCYCGKSTRQAKCGSGEINDQEVDGGQTHFSCENICQRPLDCGNHTCERVCHKGRCKPCRLKPSIITHCPCGRTSLDKLLTDSQPRQSCLDPIPTCNNTCSKVLPCSPMSGNAPSSAEHRCKQTCHHGNCGLCDGETTIVCRCGAARKEMKCSDMNAEDYLCDQRCNKKRQCGRHRCNQKCCVDKDHKCELVCGKKLRCGTHTCDEPCHRGYCPPCFMTGFDEVTCHCGSTVMYPPIPCGTPPPECPKPCSRLHPCSHQVNHLCHSEEACPPCTLLTKKMCSGNHQLRLNVPCHVVDVSCGIPCGSKLKCEHNCIKLCHKPPCDSDPCTQPCKKQRKECGHACGAPCHYGSPCPEASCKVRITITCKCGRRSENVPCLQGGDKTALAQFYQRMTTESLAIKMKDVQLGQSVDISTVIMLDEKSARYIECNDECAHSERARRMAEALGIDENVEPFGSQRMLYTPFLMSEAKNNLTFIKSIEEAFENLITIAPKLQSGQKSHSFPPMNANQRRIIHELAVHYICSSVSYDAEPKRNTVITATKASRLPPSTLSSQVERQKHPPAPPPMPYVPSDPMTESRLMKEAKEEKKPKMWAQVTDYFADDFDD